MMAELKAKSREQGLLSLFLPPRSGDTHTTTGLTNLTHAPVCKIMGRHYGCSEVFTNMSSTVATGRSLTR